MFIKNTHAAEAICKTYIHELKYPLMKVIGLTGNIASGKSTVARMLSNLGAKIIDADRIAREVVEPGKPAWNDIVKTFGSGVLNEDGTINRRKLGEIIFSSERDRKTLNDITHPRIIARIKELVDNYRKEGVSVVIIEAALIVEKGGMHDLIQGLIVVTTDEETQIKRLTERSGISRNEALSRIKSQIPASEKIKHADYVIRNTGSLEQCKASVNSIWREITGSD